MNNISSRVQVLISIFNGYNYLTYQVESIINQDNFEEISVFIRDDGSSDDSLELLKDYSSRIKLFKGKNIGVINSFFELLKLSSEDVEYYAFCDQDDVWEPDKLSRAVESLEKLPHDMPAMYFCRLDIVDENLNHLSFSNIPCKEPSFNNALLENIAIGATIVINKAARNLIPTKLPKNAVMHDWWIYLVVSAFGNIVYDEKPLIKYRQHGANVVGYKVGFFNSFRNRIRRFKKQKNLKNITRQVQEFYDIFGDRLDIEKKQIISDFLFSKNTFIKRVKYAIKSKAYRQSKIDDFIFRILYIINKI